MVFAHALLHFGFVKISRVLELYARYRNFATALTRNIFLFFLPSLEEKAAAKMG